MATSGQKNEPELVDREQLQKLMQEIQAARTKAEEMEKELSRILGEQGAQQKQMEELEAKCKSDFDCGISELPVFISQLVVAAETAKSNAQIVLGLKAGTVQKSPDSKPKPTAIKRMERHADVGDEDGLI